MGEIFRDVHWHTSPVCARILARLECKGIGMPDEIAKDVHCSKKSAYAMLRLLAQNNIVAVAFWRHNLRGPATPIYRLGPGPGKPMPRPEAPAIRSRRRRTSLIEQYGRDVAIKVLGDSRSIRGVQVFIDGKRITPGSAVRRLAGSVS